MLVTLVSTTSDQIRILSLQDTLDQAMIEKAISSIADHHLYCFDGEAFDSDVAELARLVRTGLDDGSLEPSGLRAFTDALGLTLHTHPATT
ncbi:hypothetical protein ACT3TB_16395 [Micrococcaceae sp. AOP34-BR2-30]